MNSVESKMFYFFLFKMLSDKKKKKSHSSNLLDSVHYICPVLFAGCRDRNSAQKETLAELTGEEYKAERLPFALGQHRVKCFPPRGVHFANWGRPSSSDF